MSKAYPVTLRVGYLTRRLITINYSTWSKKKDLSTMRQTVKKSDAVLLKVAPTLATCLLSSSRIALIRSVADSVSKNGMIAPKSENSKSTSVTSETI